MMKKLTKEFLISNKVHYFILLAIITFGLFLRVYGINWDQNQHLHPDERFLTMVTLDVSLPEKISTYLDQNISPLNPYNAGYDFFVYGTMPMNLVKLLSNNISFDEFDYNNITLVGRSASVALDTLTILFVYLLATVLKNKKAGLLASGFYALAILPIQLSHFFAVDTFLVFFLTATFYLYLKFFDKFKFFYLILSSITFSAALASKITTLLFAVPIGLMTVLFLVKKDGGRKKIFLGALFFLFISYLALRFFDPRVFSYKSFLNPSINPKFIENLKELAGYSDPDTWFPPAIQWLNTKPVIYPLKNLIFWGLGPFLGLLSIFSAIFCIIILVKSGFKTIRKHNFKKIEKEYIYLFSIIAWVYFLFAYQSFQFAKALRYFYPMIPFLSVISGYTLTLVSSKFQEKRFNLFNIIFAVFMFFVLINTISFMTIYSKPHTRVTASEWIYEYIPAGSTISCEHWDDCLPLPINGKSSSIYNQVTFNLFNPDTQDKWKKVNSQLDSVDYLILSSNRLWGSISKAPTRYPVTSQFYKNLLSGNTQFKKLKEFASYPTIPLLGIPLRDDYSDETFTVYDHPKVLIYKNSQRW
ncbi:glycosyltransferase family 39 protein [Candidatus Woesebacteria bacterium]|nr:glycosyltransferase family 39 protein [Candidatus Woesebacteria bacterium]